MDQLIKNKLFDLSKEYYNILNKYCGITITDNNIYNFELELKNLFNEYELNDLQYKIIINRDSMIINIEPNRLIDLITFEYLTLLY